MEYILTAPEIILKTQPSLNKSAPRNFKGKWSKTEKESSWDEYACYKDNNLIFYSDDGGRNFEFKKDDN